MKPENENKKISLIEKDGLAVEIVGCPDEHGFVFAGPLAPETVLSVSEFLTAVDAIRSRIQRMPYVMKNAIVKFPFSASSIQLTQPLTSISSSPLCARPGTLSYALSGSTSVITQSAHRERSPSSICSRRLSGSR